MELSNFPIQRLLGLRQEITYPDGPGEPTEVLMLSITPGVWTEVPESVIAEVVEGDPREYLALIYDDRDKLLSAERVRDALNAGAFYAKGLANA